MCETQSESILKGHKAETCVTLVTQSARTGKRDDGARTSEVSCEETLLQTLNFIFGLVPWWYGVLIWIACPFLKKCLSQQLQISTIGKYRLWCFTICICCHVTLGIFILTYSTNWMWYMLLWNVVQLHVHCYTVWHVSCYLTWEKFHNTQSLYKPSHWWSL